MTRVWLIGKNEMAARVWALGACVLAGVGACASLPHRTVQEHSAQPRSREGAKVTADLVFTGGDLLTMDAEHPHASALAVRGQHIVAVGSDAAIERFIGKGTRVVRLHGKTLTPGLSDAHCHLYGLGKSLESVNLRDVASATDAAKRAAVAANGLEPGEWVTGRGWDQNLWSPQKFPSKATLDAVLPKRPVALRRIDGHALWANSVALRLAGVDKSTPDPEGGAIVRDTAGEPTGVLIDNAMDLVERKLPKASEATIKRRILLAARLASSQGLTSVHEMGVSDSVLSVYRGLAGEGRLPLRVYAFLAGDADVVGGLASRVAEVDRDGTQFFVLRGIKLYADGALGSRGAAMLAPYSDDSQNSGLWVSDADELRELAVRVAKSGWQLGIHAIGDAANRAVLDAFEAARVATPGRDLRFRVEHAQVLSAADIPRFAKLNVIASMQPTHATSDMPWAEKRLGPERVRGAYPWRSLLESGAHLAAGSDFPVERVAPLLGIYAAVSRQDASGMPVAGWFPEQRMTLGEAIAAFTTEAAYASFVEMYRGRLQPGFVADLTVFDRKLLPDRSLLKAKVEMTVVSGAMKFEGDHARAALSLLKGR